MRYQSYLVGVKRALRRFGLIGIAIADGLGAVPLVGMLIVWRLRLNREPHTER